jgi:hypothetical protein
MGHDQIYPASDPESKNRMNLFSLTAVLDGAHPFRHKHHLLINVNIVQITIDTIPSLYAKNQ